MTIMEVFYKNLPPGGLEPVMSYTVNWHCDTFVAYRSVLGAAGLSSTDKF